MCQSAESGPYGPCSGWGSNLSSDGAVVIISKRLTWVQGAATLDTDVVLQTLCFATSHLDAIRFFYVLDKLKKKGTYKSMKKMYLKKQHFKKHT